MDARAWDDRYAAVSRVWSAGPNQFVEQALADLPPGTAVDLGCGEGRNARWLAERGWQVTAIDFSSVAVQRGRAETAAAGLQVNWQVGDVTSVELPAVDLVLLAYLQLPAEQRRSVVRRAWHALRPGGMLYLVAHDSSNLVEGTGGPQDPSVLFTAEDVLGDLGMLVDGGHDQNHDVIRAARVARVVPAGDDHRGVGDLVAWDVVVHLRRR